MALCRGKQPTFRGSRVNERSPFLFLPNKAALPTKPLDVVHLIQFLLLLRAQ
ncbi:hypothetical protein VCSRO58_0410 [Vibrio cholerae]|nr:hypothetical protein VCSRO58_0410 [Vibrio cholerae]